MTTDTESVTENAPEPQEQESLQDQEQQPEAQESAEEQQEEQQEHTVPLTALQKERRKRQEAEQKNRWYEELQAKGSTGQSNEEEDDSYEAATKADLKQFEKQALRAVDERSWIKENPEKFEEINESLQDFLKQRPHLAPAIENAPNRYQEAWALMTALSPKQKMDLKRSSQPAKKAAPNSPNSVPKAAGINQAVDLMSMDDAEFRKWRQSQRRR